METTPEKINEEYARGKSYKNSLDVFETVKRNENFYIGKQWEGVKAPDLPKPVLNILRRVVSYFVSMLVSDDISASVSGQDGEGDQVTQAVFKKISENIEAIIENNNMKTQNRQILRNAAVDGDACMHCYFDPNIKTGDITDGSIKTEILENTEVYFGNPNIFDVQKQPYIIIAIRKLCSTVKEETGIDVEPDDGDNSKEDNQTVKKVTVLRKYYKQSGEVWVTEVTKDVVLKNPTCLGYTLYPIAWFSWDKIKNSYHGQSCMTPVIQNQIDINRLFAMCIKQVKDGAFPKIVYNRAMLPTGWDNSVGKAIAVNGDVDRAVMRSTGVSEMSNQVLHMIELLINYTKETMGASDAALGTIKPDNTSAIIAVQKSSAMPLELQRLDFYQFIEDSVRIMFDIMSTDYGTRKMVIEINNQKQAMNFNYEVLKQQQYKINVDVGAAAYWSELAGIATLDGLFARGVFTDVALYIESLPNGALPNKENILASIKEKQQQQLQQLHAGAMLPGGEGNAMPFM